MEENKDIRDELRKYKITYSEILPYIGYKHTTRISEELALPVREGRRKVYLYAIKKVRQEKLKIYEN